MDHTTVPRGSIVVGIDGSPSADLALDWAARQAVLDQRPLTLVHAYGPDNPFWTATPAPELDALRAAREGKQARSILADAVARIGLRAPELEVHQVIARQDPRQELLDQSQSAAMVVLGSRGRGPVSSLLLGSVSVAVTAHATCPVVVLRPAPDRDSRLPLQGVLVGAQGSAISRTTFEVALRLASSRSWPLTVLQCVWNGDQEVDDVLRDVLRELTAKFPDVVVNVRSEEGFLDHHLVELSATMDAVVVGSHRLGPLDRAVFGSIAGTVVEHALGVVVVVPSP